MLLLEPNFNGFLGDLGKRRSAAIGRMHACSSEFCGACLDSISSCAWLSESWDSYVESSAKDASVRFWQPARLMSLQNFTPLRFHKLCSKAALEGIDNTDSSLAIYDKSSNVVFSGIFCSTIAKGELEFKASLLNYIQF